MGNMKRLAVIFGIVAFFCGVQAVFGQDQNISIRNIGKLIKASPRKGLWTIKQTDAIRINLVQMSGEMKMHKHPDAEHSILVYEGKIDALIGGKRFSLKKGDFVSIPKNVPHKYFVRSKRALIISMDAPYYDPKKTVMIE